MRHKYLLTVALIVTLTLGLFVPAQAKKHFQSNTKMFRITCTKDEDELYKALKKRKRKHTIIIEVSNGTVTDNKGNGKDDLGYYRGYDKKKFHKGDKVQSVFIYNPDTNYEDDIVSRVDTLIKKGK